MNIKIATLDDVPEIVLLIREFMAENDWKMTFNAERSMKTAIGYINNPKSEVFLLIDNNKCIGMALCVLSAEFHDENIGYLSKFYIHPNHRRTTAGRILLLNCNDWFKKHDCIDIFASDTAKILQEGVAFSNLLKKFKYQPCGEVFVRHK